MNLIPAAVNSGYEQHSIEKLALGLIPGFTRDYGRIDDAYLTDSKKPVFVLIQDPHVNPSGQKNIAHILETIASTQPQKTTEILLEAGSKDESLHFLKKLSKAEEIQRVSDTWLSQSKLQASEYVDLTSKYSFSLWGVEDMRLYKRSYELTTQLMRDRAKAQEYLSKTQDSLDYLKNIYLNGALELLDSKRNAHQQSKLETDSYVQWIYQTSQQSAVETSAIKHIRRFIALKRMESRIDFKKANAEQRQLIELASSSDRKLFQAINEHSSESVKAAFYEKLYVLYQKSSRPQQQQLKHLGRYLRYRGQFNLLKSHSFLEELSQLEEALEKALTTDLTEANLMLAQKKLDLIRALTCSQITAEQYQQYLRLRNVWTQDDGHQARHLSVDSTLDVPAYINKILIDNKLSSDKALFVERSFDEYIRTAEEFYELTLQRDEAFVQNIARYLRDSNSDNGVSTDSGHIRALIVGGYHATNLTKLLRDGGYSYVSIVPHVLEETNSKLYEKILFQQKNAVSAMTASSPSDTLMSVDMHMPLRIKTSGDILTFQKQLGISSAENEQLLLSGTPSKSTVSAARLSSGWSTRIKSWLSAITKYLFSSRGLVSAKYMMPVPPALPDMDIFNQDELYVTAQVTHGYNQGLMYILMKQSWFYRYGYFVWKNYHDLKKKWSLWMRPSAFSIGPEIGTDNISRFTPGAMSLQKLSTWLWRDKSRATQQVMDDMITIFQRYSQTTQKVQRHDLEQALYILFWQNPELRSQFVRLWDNAVKTSCDWHALRMFALPIHTESIDTAQKVSHQNFKYFLQKMADNDTLGMETDECGRLLASFVVEAKVHADVDDIQSIADTQRAKRDSSNTPWSLGAQVYQILLESIADRQSKSTQEKLSQLVDQLITDVETNALKKLFVWDSLELLGEILKACPECATTQRFERIMAVLSSENRSANTVKELTNILETFLNQNPELILSQWGRYLEYFLARPDVIAEESQLLRRFMIDTTVMPSAEQVERLLEHSQRYLQSAFNVLVVHEIVHNLIWTKRVKANANMMSLAGQFLGMSIILDGILRVIGVLAGTNPLLGAKGIYPLRQILVALENTSLNSEERNKIIHLFSSVSQLDDSSPVIKVLDKLNRWGEFSDWVERKFRDIAKDPAQFELLEAELGESWNLYLSLGAEQSIPAKRFLISSAQIALTQLSGARLTETSQGSTDRFSRKMQLVIQVCQEHINTLEYELKSLDEASPRYAQVVNEIAHYRKQIEKFSSLEYTTACAVLPNDVKMTAEGRAGLGEALWSQREVALALVKQDRYLEDDVMLGIMFWDLVTNYSALTMGLSYETYVRYIKGQITDSQTSFSGVIDSHHTLFFSSSKRTRLTDDEQDAIIALSVKLFRKASEIAAKSQYLNKNSLTIRELVRFNIDFSLFYMLNVHEDGAANMGKIIEQFILTAHNIYGRVLDTPEAKKEFAKVLLDALNHTYEGQKLIFKAMTHKEIEWSVEQVLETMEFADYETSSQKRLSARKSRSEAGLEAMIERSYQVKRPLLLVTEPDDVPLVEDAFETIDHADGTTIRIAASAFSKRKDMFGMYMPKEVLSPDREDELISSASTGQLMEAIMAVRPQEFTEAPTEQQLSQITSDAFLRSSVAVFLSDPQHYQDAMTWHDGFLVRLSQLAQQSPDKRFTVIIDNVEALPGRVRIQLNPVLWERNVNVPSRGQDVPIPQNLQFIFTMDRQSMIHDDSFLNRTLVHYTSSMRSASNLYESYAGYLRRKTGVSSQTEAHIWHMLTMLDGDGMRFTSMDGLRIAQRVAGRRQDGDKRPEIEILSEEAESYLKLRVPHKSMWTELEQGLEKAGLTTGHQPSIEFDAQGFLVLDGVKVPTHQTLRGMALEHKGKAPQGILAMFSDGYVMGPIELRVMSQYARDYRYGAKAAHIEGAPGEGKTTSARVFSAILGLQVDEKTISAETDLGDFRGSFIASTDGNFYFREAQYISRLEQGGWAQINNEINTVPDGALYYWMAPEISGHDVKYLPEYANDASVICRQIRINPNGMRFFAVNSEDQSGRYPVPEKIKAMLPTYYFLTDDNDLESFVSAKMQEDAQLAQYTSFASVVHAVHVAIKKARYQDALMNSPQDITKRFLLRWMARFKQKLQDSQTGSKVPNPSILLTESLDETYALVWGNTQDVQIARDIIKQILPKTMKNVASSTDKALSVALSADDPVIVFCDASVERPVDLISAALSDVDQKLGTETQVVDIPLGFHYGKKQWLGTWMPRAPDSSKAENTDTTSASKKSKFSFELGILPSIIAQARFMAASSNRTPGKKASKIAVILRNYHRINPKNASALNEFLPTGYLDAMQELLTQENADNLFEQIQDLSVEGQVDLNVLASGYTNFDMNELKNNAEERMKFAKWFYLHRPDNLKIIATASSEEEVQVGGAELDRLTAVNISRRWDATIAGQKVTSELQKEKISSPLITQAVQYAQEAFNAYENCGNTFSGDYPHNRLGAEDIETFISEIKYAQASGDLNSEKVQRIAYYVLGIGLRVQDRQQLSFSPTHVTPEVVGAVGFRRDAKRQKWMFFADGFEIETNHPWESDPSQLEYLAPTTHTVRNLAALIIAWRHGRISVIEGHPGGGKSAITVEMAKRMGVPNYDQLMYEGIDLGTFLGKFSKKGKDYIVTSFPDSQGRFSIDFLKAYTEGGIVNLDEGSVGTSSQEVISFLALIAQSEYLDLSKYQPGYSGPVLKRHPNFRLYITQNPANQTRDRLDIPYGVDTVASKIWTDNELSRDDARLIIDHYLGVEFRDQVSDTLKDAMANIHSQFLKVHPSKEDLSPRQLILMVSGLVRLLRSPGHHSELDKKREIFRGAVVAYYERLSEEQKLEMEPTLSSNIPEFSRLMHEWLGDAKRDSLGFGGIALGFAPGQSNVSADEIVFPEDIPSQNGVLRSMAYGLSLGMPVALIESEGADALDVAKKFASKTGCELETLWAHPHMNRSHLLNSLMPVFKEAMNEYGVQEADLNEDFRMAYGFLARHMMRRDEYEAAREGVDAHTQKILFFHMMDSIPEKQRVILNMFLSRLGSTRSIFLDNEEGISQEYVLPEWVSIVISSGVEHQYSSAFINRFLPLRVECFTESETRDLVRRHYPLVDDREFDWLWTIMERSRNLDEQGFFNIRHGFGRRDIFKLAQTVQQLKKRDWLPLKQDPLYYVLEATQLVLMAGVSDQDLELFESSVMASLVMEIFAKPLKEGKISLDQLADYYAILKWEIFNDLSHVEKTPVKASVHIGSVPENEDYVFPSGLRIRFDDAQKGRVIITTPARSYYSTLTAMQDGHSLKGSDICVYYDPSTGQIDLRYDVIAKVGRFSIPMDDWNLQRALPESEVPTTAFIKLTESYNIYLASLINAWQRRLDKAGHEHAPRVVMICGETGQAKTTGLINFSEQTGIPLYIVNAYEDLKTADVTQDMRVETNKATLNIKELLARIGKVRPKGSKEPFRKVIVPGKKIGSRSIIVIDEANASAELLYALAPLFRGEKHFTFEYAGQALEVELEDEVLVALTFNPAETYSDRGEFAQEIAGYATHLWPPDPVRYTDDTLALILKEYNRRGITDTADAMKRKQGSTYDRPKEEGYEYQPTILTTGSPIETQDMNAEQEHKQLMPQKRYASPNDVKAEPKDEWVQAIINKIQNIRTVSPEPLLPVLSDGVNIDSAPEQQPDQFFQLDYDLDKLAQNVATLSSQGNGLDKVAFVNNALGPFLQAVSDLALNESQSQRTLGILQAMYSLCNQVDPDIAPFLMQIHQMYLRGNVSELTLDEAIMGIRRILASQKHKVYLIAQAVGLSHETAPFIFVQGHAIEDIVSPVEESDFTVLGINRGGPMRQFALPKAIVLNNPPQKGLSGYYEGEFAVVFRSGVLDIMQEMGIVGQVSTDLVEQWVYQHEIGHMIDDQRSKAEGYPVPDNLELNAMLMPLIITSEPHLYIRYELFAWLSKQADPKDVYAQAIKGILNGLWLRLHETQPKGDETSSAFDQAEMEAALISDNFESGKIRRIVDYCLSFDKEELQSAAAYIYNHRSDYLYTARPGSKDIVHTSGEGWQKKFSAGLDKGYQQNIIGKVRQDIKVNDRNEKNRPAFKPKPVKSASGDGKGGQGSPPSGMSSESDQPSSKKNKNQGTSDKTQQGSNAAPQKGSNIFSKTVVNSRVIRRFVELFGANSQFIKYLAEEGDEFSIEELLRNIGSSEVFIGERLIRAAAQGLFGVWVDVSGSTSYTKVSTKNLSGEVVTVTVNEVFKEAAYLYAALFAAITKKNKKVQFALGAHGNGLHPMLSHRDSLSPAKIQEALQKLERREPNEGNHFEDVLKGIIRLHEKTDKKLPKLEIVISDGELEPVDKINALLTEAHQKGIDIVILGYGTPQVLQFSKSVNIPQGAGAEEVMEAIVKIAMLKRKKGIGGMLPNIPDLGREIGFTSTSTQAGARMAIAPNSSTEEPFRDIHTAKSVYSHLAAIVAHLEVPAYKLAVFHKAGLIDLEFNHDDLSELIRDNSEIGSSALLARKLNELVEAKVIDPSDKYWDDFDLSAYINELYQRQDGVVSEQAYVARDILAALRSSGIIRLNDKRLKALDTNKLLSAFIWPDPALDTLRSFGVETIPFTYIRKIFSVKHLFRPPDYRLNLIQPSQIRTLPILQLSYWAHWLSPLLSFVRNIIPFILLKLGFSTESQFVYYFDTWALLDQLTSSEPISSLDLKTLQWIGSEVFNSTVATAIRTATRVAYNSAYFAQEGDQMLQWAQSIRDLIKQGLFSKWDVRVDTLIDVLLPTQARLERLNMEQAAEILSLLVDANVLSAQDERFAQINPQRLVERAYAEHKASLIRALGMLMQRGIVSPSISTSKLSRKEIEFYTSNNTLLMELLKIGFFNSAQVADIIDERINDYRNAAEMKFDYTFPSSISDDMEIFAELLALSRESHSGAEIVQEVQAHKTMIEAIEFYLRRVTEDVPPNAFHREEPLQRLASAFDSQKGFADPRLVDLLESYRIYQSMLRPGRDGGVEMALAREAYEAMLGDFWRVDSTEGARFASTPDSLSTISSNTAPKITENVTRPDKLIDSTTSQPLLRNSGARLSEWIQTIKGYFERRLAYTYLRFLSMLLKRSVDIESQFVWKVLFNNRQRIEWAMSTRYGSILAKDVRRSDIDILLTLASSSTEAVSVKAVDYIGSMLLGIRSDSDRKIAFSWLRPGDTEPIVEAISYRPDRQKTDRMIRLLQLLVRMAELTQNTQMLRSIFSAETLEKLTKLRPQDPYICTDRFKVFLSEGLSALEATGDAGPHLNPFTKKSLIQILNPIILQSDYRFHGSAFWRENFQVIQGIINIYKHAVRSSSFVTQERIFDEEFILFLMNFLSHDPDFMMNQTLDMDLMSGVNSAYKYPEGPRRRALDILQGMRNFMTLGIRQGKVPSPVTQHVLRVVREDLAYLGPNSRTTMLGIIPTLADLSLAEDIHNIGQQSGLYDFVVTAETGKDSTSANDADSALILYLVKCCQANVSAHIGVLLEDENLRHLLSRYSPATMLADTTFGYILTTYTEQLKYHSPDELKSIGEEKIELLQALVQATSVNSLPSEDDPERARQLVWNAIHQAAAQKNTYDVFSQNLLEIWRLSKAVRAPGQASADSQNPSDTLFARQLALLISGDKQGARFALDQTSRQKMDVIRESFMSLLTQQTATISSSQAPSMFHLDLVQTAISLGWLSPDFVDGNIFLSPFLESMILVDGIQNPNFIDHAQRIVRQLRQQGVVLRAGGLDGLMNNIERIGTFLKDVRDADIERWWEFAVRKIEDIHKAIGFGSLDPADKRLESIDLTRASFLNDVSTKRRKWRRASSRNFYKIARMCIDSEVISSSHIMIREPLSVVADLRFKTQLFYRLFMGRLYSFFGRRYPLAPRLFLNLSNIISDALYDLHLPNADVNGSGALRLLNTLLEKKLITQQDIASLVQARKVEATNDIFDNGLKHWSQASRLDALVQLGAMASEGIISESDARLMTAGIDFGQIFQGVPHVMGQDLLVHCIDIVISLGLATPQQIRSHVRVSELIRFSHVFNTKFIDDALRRDSLDLDHLKRVLKLADLGMLDTDEMRSLQRDIASIMAYIKNKWTAPLFVLDERALNDHAKDIKTIMLLLSSSLDLSAYAADMQEELWQGFVLAPYFGYENAITGHGSDSLKGPNNDENIYISALKILKAKGYLNTHVQSIRGVHIRSHFRPGIQMLWEGLESPDDDQKLASFYLLTDLAAAGLIEDPAQAISAIDLVKLLKQFNVPFQWPAVRDRFILLGQRLQKVIDEQGLSESQLESVYNFVLPLLKEASKVDARISMLQNLFLDVVDAMTQQLTSVAVPIEITRMTDSEKIAMLTLLNYLIFNWPEPITTLYSPGSIHNYQYQRKLKQALEIPGTMSRLVEEYRLYKVLTAPFPQNAESSQLRPAQRIFLESALEIINSITGARLSQPTASQMDETTPIHQLEVGMPEDNRASVTETGSRLGRIREFVSDMIGALMMPLSDFYKMMREVAVNISAFLWWDMGLSKMFGYQDSLSDENITKRQGKLFARALERSDFSPSIFQKFIDDLFLERHNFDGGKYDVRKNAVDYISRLSLAYHSYREQNAITAPFPVDAQMIESILDRINSDPKANYWPYPLLAIACILPHYNSEYDRQVLLKLSSPKVLGKVIASASWDGRPKMFNIAMNSFIDEYGKVIEVLREDPDFVEPFNEVNLTGLLRGFQINGLHFNPFLSPSKILHSVSETDDRLRAFGRNMRIATEHGAAPVFTKAVFDEFIAKTLFDPRTETGPQATQRIIRFHNTRFALDVLRPFLEDNLSHQNENHPIDAEFLQRFNQMLDDTSAENLNEFFAMAPSIIRLLNRESFAGLLSENGVLSKILTLDIGSEGEINTRDLNDTLFIIAKRAHDEQMIHEFLSHFKGDNLRSLLRMEYHPDTSYSPEVSKLAYRPKNSIVFYQLNKIISTASLASDYPYSFADQIAVINYLLGLDQLIADPEIAPLGTKDSEPITGVEIYKILRNASDDPQHFSHLLEELVQEWRVYKSFKPLGKKVSKDTDPESVYLRKALWRVLHSDTQAGARFASVELNNTNGQKVSFATSQISSQLKDWFLEDAKRINTENLLQLASFLRDLDIPEATALLKLISKLPSVLLDANYTSQQVEAVFADQVLDAILRYSPYALGAFTLNDQRAYWATFYTLSSHLNDASRWRFIGDMVIAVISSHVEIKIDKTKKVSVDWISFIAAMELLFDREESGSIWISIDEIRRVYEELSIKNTSGYAHKMTGPAGTYLFTEIFNLSRSLSHGARFASVELKNAQGEQVTFHESDVYYALKEWISEDAGRISRDNIKSLVDLLKNSNIYTATDTMKLFSELPEMLLSLGRTQKEIEDLFDNQFLNTVLSTSPYSGRAGSLTELQQYWMAVYRLSTKLRDKPRWRFIGSLLITVISGYGQFQGKTNQKIYVGIADLLDILPVLFVREDIERIWVDLDEIHRISEEMSVKDDASDVIYMSTPVGMYVLEETFNLYQANKAGARLSLSRAPGQLGGSLVHSVLDDDQLRQMGQFVSGLPTSHKGTSAVMPVYSSAMTGPARFYIYRSPKEVRIYPLRVVSARKIEGEVKPYRFSYGISKSKHDNGAREFLSHMRLSLSQATMVSPEIRLDQPSAISLDVTHLKAFNQAASFERAFESVFVQALLFSRSVRARKPDILISGFDQLGVRQKMILRSLLQKYPQSSQGGSWILAEAQEYEGLVFTPIQVGASVGAVPVVARNQISLPVATLWTASDSVDLIQYLYQAFSLVQSVQKSAWDQRELSVDTAKLSGELIPAGVVEYYAKMLQRPVLSADIVDLIKSSDISIQRAFALRLPLIQKLDWRLIADSVRRSVLSAA